MSKVEYIETPDNTLYVGYLKEEGSDCEWIRASGFDNVTFELKITSEDYISTKEKDYDEIEEL